MVVNSDVLLCPKPWVCPYKPVCNGCCPVSPIERELCFMKHGFLPISI